MTLRSLRSHCCVKEPLPLPPPPTPAPTKEEEEEEEEEEATHVPVRHTSGGRLSSAKLMTRPTSEHAPQRRASLR